MVQYVDDTSESVSFLICCEFYCQDSSENKLRCRVKHGPQQSVPEGMFDDSIKLVVWGHEHDCRIWPEKVEGKEYYITQPGSSVATSLAPGEALPKHVGLLSIQGSQFQISEIPLKTVRPFELDEVVLTEIAVDEGMKVNLEDKDTITAYLRSRVSQLPWNIGLMARPITS